MIHQTLMLVGTQAWQIAVLFFVILILFRLLARNRPHVAHLLWAVLLIKCLIPPVVSSSWAPFSWITHSMQQWLPTEAAASNKTAEYITYSTQPRSSFRSQPTEETSSTKHANDSLMLNPSWQSYLANTERTLIVFWIGSIAFVIVVWASRFVHVLRRLRLHRIETPTRVTKITDDLVQLLSLRRKICVQVSNERIGPAVLGWLRPRILLPSFLVDRMDDEALRILIAHEMTHIRRGDLFWAFLQTVAGSLWWFHPAVWIANRQLNLECERSCDEETIARLECPPCDYAKCLLQVLEWKHQLYVVPALPGVRPMQVTKDRLERIMKMRHGSFKQNSRGLWLAMAAAVLFVAPGAEYGISQQSTTTLQEPTNVEKQPSRLPLGGTVTSDLGVAGQVILEGTPPSNASERSTRVYNVADLLEQIVADNAAKKEEARKHLERQLTCYEVPAIPPTGVATLTYTSLWYTTPAPAPPLPLNANPKADGEFSLQNGKFIATTSEINHQWIKTELARCREFGFKTLVHSVAFFESKQKINLQLAQLEWENEESFEWAILDSGLLAYLSKLPLSDKRIANPILRSRNGDCSAMHVFKQYSLLYRDVITSELVPNTDACVEVGTKVEITSRLNQDQTLEQEISLYHSFLLPDEEKKTGEEKPVLLSSSIRTKKSLPKHKSILIRYFIPHPTNANDGFHFLFLIHSEVEAPESYHYFSPTIDIPNRLIQRKNKQS
jgi:beta-lactamase regulating signal transducer with metallopeptidase domain